MSTAYGAQSMTAPLREVLLRRPGPNFAAAFDDAAHGFIHPTVADDLAVVFPPLLPAGLYELLADEGIRTLAVAEQEFATLGCNVLAVRPGVVIVAAGNPSAAAALADAGCEVHTLDLSEIGLNGSGGPTCLTRPIWRETS